MSFLTNAAPAKPAATMQSRREAANATSRARAEKLFLSIELGGEGYKVREVERKDIVEIVRPESARAKGGPEFYTLDVSRLEFGFVVCDCPGFGNYATCCHAEAFKIAYFAALPVESNGGHELEAAPMVPVTASHAAPAVSDNPRKSLDEIAAEAAARAAMPWQEPVRTPKPKDGW